MRDTKTFKIGLILILMTFKVLCQDDIKIIGRVVDKETNEPLAYAHIGIMGNTIGTVSNVNGEFEFNIPSTISDSVFFSYVGYNTFRLSIVEAQDLKVFYLKPGATLLGDLVISPDELTAKQIVEMAIENISKNYPVKPVLLEGFYRDWYTGNKIELNKKTALVLEASINIYDKGYGETRKTTEKVYLLEIRKAHQGAWNTLHRLLTQNFVKYNRSMGNFDMVQGVLDFPNKFDYNIVKLYIENGKNLYVVKASAPGYSSSYKLYINQLDYAIIRIDLTGNIDSGLPFGEGIAPDGRRVVWVDNTLRFNKYKSKYYLGYLRSNWVTEKVHLETKKVLETEEFYNELLINNLITDGVQIEEKRKRMGNKIMRRGKPLARQSGGFNEEFWTNYNMVKDNPVRKELLELYQNNDQ